MRMQEKIRQLNQAAAGNNYKEIEEIAHSLKGFTGQTCIYEISNRASIILDEIRSNKDDPHLDVIRRELASLNEIIYLLPRKFIGITPRLRPALEKPIHPEFPPMKILVAEDNPINQAVIKDFLRHFNLSCTLVDNGLSALKELQSDAFDILFLDIQMPVMNGIETLKRIRMDSHLGDVFVVVLTAYVFEVSNDKFLQNNCDAFLIKPFEKKHLLEILQKAAENYKKKSTEKII